jgi:hypothetical protein
MGSARLCQLVLLASVASFYALNATAWCEEPNVSDCESLLDSTTTEPVKRITSDYLRCIVNARMTDDPTVLTAISDLILTGENSRAKITHDPDDQETIWTVSIKSEFGLSRPEQEKVTDDLRSILDSALKESGLLKPEERESILANTEFRFGVLGRPPVRSNEPHAKGNKEQQEKRIDDPLADDAKNDEKATDDPFRDEPSDTDEQLADEDKQQEKKRIDDPLADDAEGDEKATDDPFRDELPDTDEPLTDEVEQQEKKRIDDPLADDAEGDGKPTGSNKEQQEKPLEDRLADDAGGDKEPPDTRTAPEDTPLEEHPDSLRVDELTGPILEEKLRKLLKEDDSGDPDIDIIRDSLDPDSIQVKHNPQTKETDISILTKDGKNLTRERNEELQEAVEHVFESVLEKEVPRSNDEHDALVSGLEVDLGPHREGPKPIQPNVAISGEKSGNGNSLEITARLDKPAVDDSTLDVAVQVGQSHRTVTIKIPKGNTSAAIDVPVPEGINRIITGGRPPRGGNVGSVVITKTQGLAMPWGPNGFTIVTGGTPGRFDRVSHSPPMSGSDAVESCLTCGPVSCCPTCRRRFGRR